MTLPESDLEYLATRELPHEIVAEAGMTCVLLKGWALPAGYDRATADLLIRLQAGYPDLPPDMWWLEPAIACADGRAIQATEVREQHLGRVWQRWSRHFQAGQWQSGIDGLESFVALINRELARCASEAA